MTTPSTALTTYLTNPPVSHPPHTTRQSFTRFLTAHPQNSANLTLTTFRTLNSLRADITRIRRAQIEVVDSLNNSLKELQDTQAAREAVLTEHFSKQLRALTVRALTKIDAELWQREQQAELGRQYRGDLEVVAKGFEVKKRALERTAGARMMELRAEREKTRGLLRQALGAEGQRGEKEGKALLLQALRGGKEQEKEKNKEEEGRMAETEDKNTNSGEESVSEKMPSTPSSYYGSEKGTPPSSPLFTPVKQGRSLQDELEDTKLDDGQA